MANRILFPILVLPTILAACATSEYTVGKTGCDAQAHQALVGMNIGEVSLPPKLPKRVMNEGDPATMDFNAQRLNIIVDEKGWIERAYCG